MEKPILLKSWNIQTGQLTGLVCNWYWYLFLMQPRRSPFHLNDAKIQRLDVLAIYLYFKNQSLPLLNVLARLMSIKIILIGLSLVKISDSFFLPHGNTIQ
jgi:hypothetical protein